MKSRQRGVALVLALVFLLLLTLLGITALNTSSLEEKMANNVKDRNLAFQAAEAAMTLAESWLYAQLSLPTFTSNTAGLYEPSTSSTPRWDSVDWSSSSAVLVYPNTPASGVSVSGASALSKVTTQPKYIIEELDSVQETGGTLTVDNDHRGTGVNVLRITARGTGGTDAAVVMLQSVFSRAY